MLKFYSKPQGQFEKRIPPQGQQYPTPVHMGPPMYGPPASMSGPRFGMSLGDPESERLSPRGDEESVKKNDKEEARERARKLREEEKKRLAKRSIMKCVRTDLLGHLDSEFSSRSSLA